MAKGDDDPEDAVRIQHSERHLIPKELLNIFNRLLESSALRSVVLRFHHQVARDGYWSGVRQSSEFRQEAIKQIMSSLVSAPKLPRELAIQNLHNVKDEDPTAVEMITKVLQGLQSLRLNIVNEDSESSPEYNYMVLSTTSQSVHMF